MDIGNLTKKT